MEIKNKIIALTADVLLRSIYASCRIEVYGLENEEEVLTQRGDIIYTSWHRIFPFASYHFRDRNMGGIISASRDGDMITALIERYGFRPQRGSSRRGGKEALHEFCDHLASGYPGVITPDGPTGPPYISKHGITTIAGRTGSPILLCAMEADRSWEFNSWDRTVLAKPFSRIVMVFDREPILVAPEMSDAATDELRQEIDLRLNRLTYQVRYFVKNGIREGDPRDLPVPDDFMDYLPRKIKKAAG